MTNHPNPQTEDFWEHKTLSAKTRNIPAKSGQEVGQPNIDTQNGNQIKFSSGYSSHLCECEFMNK